MGEILFLAHRIPFPPDRGDKIRSHNLLKRLAEIAPVHVATLADDDADMAHEGDLAAIAASYRLVRRCKPLALAGVQALATRAPVSLTAFHHQALSRYVEETVRTRPIHAIYVFSGQMGQYVPEGFAGRVIADFVDVDSAKFEAYAARGEGLRGWIDAREARMLRAEEARLAGRADVSLLISQAEACLFRSRLPDGLRGKVAVRVLPNGIDAESFDPALADPEPRILECGGPRVIFTGQMDYAPNIAAAARVMDRIVPAIREQAPNASFHVVGRNPPDHLLRRNGAADCHVWGGVPDMRPWLKGADIALVPLEIGRGVQNKVLEAMAMALPVVLTPEAAAGIEARDGEQFLIGDSDLALAEAVLALWRDKQRASAIGAAARRFVIETMSWPAALAPLPEIVAPGARRCSHAA
jgi:polysaccharide biosynthesis protein PslH